MGTVNDQPRVDRLLAGLLRVKGREGTTDGWHCRFAAAGRHNPGAGRCGVDV
jgi:hypothetical protein